MKIELVEVKSEQKDILKNLLEYYSYDFCKYYSYDLNENGKFELIDSNLYFYNNKDKALFVMVDGKYAGFILLRYMTKIIIFEEFWIMPKYRNGMFTYRVLKQFPSIFSGRVRFSVMNKNERWLEAIEYMLNKNKNYCKIIAKRKIDYNLKWGKFEFTEFVIECFKNETLL